MDWSLHGPLVQIALLVPFGKKIRSRGWTESDVFAVVGDPEILHSDNGRDFVNKIVENVVKQ